jgi:hypothetical protein
MQKMLAWLSFALLMSLLAVTDPFLSTPRSRPRSDRSLPNGTLPL